MKKLLAVLLALVLPFAANARVISVATGPNTGETISLTDARGDCPSGTAGDGFKWEAHVAVYQDPRDGEREVGCYIFDTRVSPVEVVLIFLKGSLSGAPLVLPLSIFKPEI